MTLSYCHCFSDLFYTHGHNARRRNQPGFCLKILRNQAHKSFRSKRIGQKYYAKCVRVNNFGPKILCPMCTCKISGQQFIVQLLHWSKIYWPACYFWSKISCLKVWLQNFRSLLCESLMYHFPQLSSMDFL